MTQNGGVVARSEPRPGADDGSAVAGLGTPPPGGPGAVPAGDGQHAFEPSGPTDLSGPTDSSGPSGPSGAGGPSGGTEPSGRTEPSGPIGSKPSFASFYLEQFASAVRLAAALTGDGQTAEDLAQDAFVRLHGRWESVRAPEHYLRRSVVNACRSHHRRAARARARSVAPTDARWSDADRWLDGAGPEGQADRGAVAEPQAVAGPDLDDALGSALGLLPHRQRAAIVLRYYADLPDVAIAATLGCRVGTVASLIHRGLSRLREVVTP